LNNISFEIQGKVADDKCWRWVATEIKTKAGLFFSQNPKEAVLSTKNMKL